MKLQIPHFSQGDPIIQCTHQSVAHLEMNGTGHEADGPQRVGSLKPTTDLYGAGGQ